MSEKDYLCENMNFAVKEAFNRLRTNIQFSFTDNGKCKVIGVTSSRVSEGKSTTSVNLAWTLAQMEQKVLLVDCDMRRPSLNVKLSFNQTPGLSNLLTEINAVGETISEYKPTDSSKAFSVIPAGDIPPNPSELLGSERMGRLITAMRTKYDYIILDMPPVGAVADAQLISKLTDGMLVVLRENGTPKRALAECLSQLELAKCRILGFVLNGTVEGAKKKYNKYGYGSYSNNSGYGYGNYGSYGYYQQPKQQ